MIVVALLSLPFLYIVLRKPILRRLALRNATRRPRETALVILGSLLGTAIMMDERLVAFDAQPEPAIFLEVLERRNHRHSLQRLRDTFVAWAAAGVAATGDLSAYTKALENVPERVWIDRTGVGCYIRGETDTIAA